MKAQNMIRTFAGFAAILLLMLIVGAIGIKNTYDFALLGAALLGGLIIGLLITRSILSPISSEMVEVYMTLAPF